MKKAEANEPKSARDIQVGGEHYLLGSLPKRVLASIQRTKRIEPWDIWEAFRLDPWTANAVKYLLRWKNKNGLQDLEKAKHYIEELIEQERAKLE